MSALTGRRVVDLVCGGYCHGGRVPSAVGAATARPWGAGPAAVDVPMSEPPPCLTGPGGDRPPRMLCRPFPKLHVARRAFSLLELIVVLVVLGLLAAAAIPTFARVQDRAVVAADESTFGAVAREVQALAASGGGVITRADVSATLADCGGCLLGAAGGPMAAPSRWVVVDPADPGTHDPEVPSGEQGARAGTYGYVAGEGWGTGRVHLVMASRSDGVFVHADVVTWGTLTVWTDANSSPSGTPPDPDAPAPIPAVDLPISEYGTAFRVSVTAETSEPIDPVNVALFDDADADYYTMFSRSAGAGTVALAVVFDEPMDLESYFFSAGLTRSSGYRVRTSPDSTNGLDGTWFAHDNWVNGNVDDVQLSPLDVHGVRAVRFEAIMQSSALDVWVRPRSLRLRGSVASGQPTPVPDPDLIRYSWPTVSATAYRVNLGAGVTEPLPLDQLERMDDGVVEDHASIFGNSHSGVWGGVALVFDDPIDIDEYLLDSQHTRAAVFRVRTSPDTTDGLNGTWFTHGDWVRGDLADGTWQSFDMHNVRGLRFEVRVETSALEKWFRVNSLRVRGRPATGAPQPAPVDPTLLRWDWPSVGGVAYRVARSVPPTSSPLSSFETDLVADTTSDLVEMSQARGHAGAVAVVFPEPVTLTGYFIDAVRTRSDVQLVQVSTDTTDGADGTWVSHGTWVDGDVEAPAVTELQAAGVRGIRFEYQNQSTNFDRRFRVAALRLYGTVP